MLQTLRLRKPYLQIDFQVHLFFDIFSIVMNNFISFGMFTFIKRLGTMVILFFLQIITIVLDRVAYILRGSVFPFILLFSFHV